MSEKHTPGRWEAETVGPYQTFIRGVGSGPDTVIANCAVSVRISDEQKAANARLIAAAPDLLEAMEGIEHFSDAVAYRTDPVSVALRQWIDAGRAAITRATTA